MRQVAEWVDVVIPARSASSRLPGKLSLPDASGVPIIRRVVLAACEWKRATGQRGNVVVLFPWGDNAIPEAVGPATWPTFSGGGVTLEPSRKPHENGMSRVAEYLAPLEMRGRLILHVQADEPEILPVHLAALEDAALSLPVCDCATLSAIATESDREDPNVVKVARGEYGFATRFSRTLSGDRHIGVYAYRPAFAMWHASIGESDAERAERLEQLRTFNRGARFRVVTVDSATAPRGVDTREDYERFVGRDAGRLARQETARQNARDAAGRVAAAPDVVSAAPAAVDA